MEDICRLCCSTNFVNNNIFDEENALYLKMSLYLPIKVFKNDRLPQKVCDKCSCKVNDFYQFCNETIEVQQRLRRAVLLSAGLEIEDSIDLTLIKQNDLSPMPPHYSDGYVHKVEPPTEHNGDHSGGHITHHRQYACAETAANSTSHRQLCDQTTQTEEHPPKTSPQWPGPPLFPNMKVKEEPKAHVMKQEIEEYDEGTDADTGTENIYEGSAMDDMRIGDVRTAIDSDCSEDNVSLSVIKKERKKRKKQTNGQQKERRKRGAKLKSLEDLVGDALALMPFSTGADDEEDKKPVVKSEPVEFHCCVCFVQCFSRTEMLHHYKEHLSAAMASRGPPPAPPPPPKEPIKCTRCLKSLEVSEWAAHWLAHWQRDARPLRCALCEKSFRDHAQILRHGLTHKGGETTTVTDQPKRFACDVCGEAFVYMRCLLAHRLSAHPESSTRALALRCAVCERTFAHLNSLRRHLRAHTGERNFLCSVCGKALSSREHLKFHLRIHTGYKPNVCKTCGKGFVKKCNLTLHERVHSGEKPHVCSSCGKAFSQRSTLVIHERYHSGARPYVCGLCGRGFVAKGLLSMHLKTTCI